MSTLLFDQLISYSYIIQLFSLGLLVMARRIYIQTRIKNVPEIQPLNKVLLVDDDPDIIKLCRKTLERYKVEVVSTDDGRHAIRIVEEHNDFDIIITDIYMTHMDGIELSSRLHSELPVLVISSGPKNNLLDQLFKNSDGHINKKYLRHKLYPYALQAIENWKSCNVKKRRKAS